MAHEFGGCPGNYRHHDGGRKRRADLRGARACGVWLSDERARGETPARPQRVKRDQAPLHPPVTLCRLAGAAHRPDRQDVRPAMGRSVGPLRRL
jgi:hypothetical protein